MASGLEDKPRDRAAGPPQEIKQCEEVHKCWDRLKELGEVEKIEDLSLSRPVKGTFLDDGINMEHHAFKNQKSIKIKHFTSRKKRSQIHGTAVAAVGCGGSYIGRDKNNNMWRLENGVAPFARLLVGTVGFKAENVAKGIYLAIKKKADVICISLSSPVLSPLIAEAIYKAEQTGITIVCCASNTSTIQYPGKMDNVICVGSHNKHYEVSAFSPNGREIDFLGPGEDIYTADSSGHDAILVESGTSLATPYIAGICLLVIAYADLIGTKYDRDDLRKKVTYMPVMKMILRSCATHPEYHDQRYGFGSLKPSKLFRFDEKYFIDMVDRISQNPREDWSPHLGVSVQTPLIESSTSFSPSFQSTLKTIGFVNVGDIPTNFRNTVEIVREYCIDNGEIYETDGVISLVGQTEI